MSEQTFRVFTTTSIIDVKADDPRDARAKVKKDNPRANIVKVKVARDCERADA